jgi:hypothetical protein
MGDQITLAWTMPRRTTDKLALKGMQTVQICRSIGESASSTVGTMSYEAGKPASYDDTLPADSAAGSPQLAAYSIEVLNAHGRSAGASNLAYSASGAAPPAFQRASGEITANGVVLRWEPAPLPGTVHEVVIERTLLSLAAPPGSEVKPASQAPLGGGPSIVKEQSLVVHLPPGPDSGMALDPDAAFDQRYSYRISRATVFTLEAKSIEIQGPASTEIVVDTKDVFPPAVPTGLVAIAVPDDGAIDLSWEPNVESDLAGYSVYRSEPGGAPIRISPPGKSVDTPAFRDSTAVAGRDYAYSVTAIDRDGNESARSAQVKETLPRKP